MKITPQYLAGLLDGEGCIFVMRCIERGRVRHQLKVEVSNTYLPVLRSLQKQFGGYLGAPPVRNPKWRQCFRLEWTGALALKILRVVLSYLIVKRRQAKLVLGKWRMFPSKRGLKSGVPKIQLLSREALYLELRELKKKDFTRKAA